MMITNNKKTTLGIYIHIPFCVCRCRYCGFLSFADTVDYLQRQYIDSLINEIRLYGSLYKGEYIADTVFIGGGTPSVIDKSYIGDILTAVGESFELTADCEITIETNPGTLDKDKLASYKDYGINRLSIGAQSMNDNILKSLGRIHCAKEFQDNFALARESGFDNINIDLMFAVPGHTLEIWRDTLQKSLLLQPEHISFYSLQIEEGTPFADMYEAGILQEVDDDTDRKMYKTAVDLLSAGGYMHYEISNASKPGYMSRHNLKYWNMNEYIGLGAGASSYIKGRRFQNTDNLDEYIRLSRQSCFAGQFDCFKTAGSVAEFHHNTEFDQASEFVFTGLRKLQGINIDDFKNFVGRDFFDVFPEAENNINKWMSSGFAEFDGRNLRLTYEGINISNDILSEFV